MHVHDVSTCHGARYTVCKGILTDTLYYGKLCILHNDYIYYPIIG